MSYTPTNWQNGKTPINETNLNKLEQGIVEIDTTRNLHTYTHVSQIGLTNPQTIKEIIDALPANSEIIFGVASGSVLSNDTPLEGKPCEIRATKTTTSGGGRGIVEIKRHNGSDIYSNHYYNGALIGWERHVLGNDLTNYLPLSGGEMNGNIYVINNNVAIQANDGTHSIALVATNGYVGLYDHTFNKWVLRVDMNEKMTFAGISVGAYTLDGLTASVAELNHMKGVTSGVQAQIDALKARIEALENK